MTRRALVSLLLALSACDAPDAGPGTQLHVWRVAPPVAPQAAEIYATRLGWPASADVADPMLAAVENEAGGRLTVRLDGTLDYRDASEPLPGEAATDDVAIAGASALVARLGLLSRADVECGAGNYSGCPLLNLEVLAMRDRELPRSADGQASFAQDLMVELTPRLPAGAAADGTELWGPVANASILVSVDTSGHPYALRSRWIEPTGDPIVVPARPEGEALAELLARGITPRGATLAIGYDRPADHHGGIHAQPFYYPEYRLVTEKSGPHGIVPVAPATRFMPRLAAMNVPAVLPGGRGPLSVALEPGSGTAPIDVRWDLLDGAGLAYTLGHGTTIEVAIPDGPYHVRIAVSDANGHHHDVYLPLAVWGSPVSGIAAPAQPSLDLARAVSVCKSSTFMAGSCMDPVCTDDLEMGVKNDSAFGTDCDSGAVASYLYDKMKKRMFIYGLGVRYFTYQLRIKFLGREFDIRSDTCALSPGLVGARAPNVCSFPSGAFAKAVEEKLPPERTPSGFKTRRIIKGLPGTLTLTMHHSLDEQVYAGEELPYALGFLGGTIEGGKRLGDIGLPKPGIDYHVDWEYLPSANNTCKWLKEFCAQAETFMTSCGTECGKPYEEAEETGAPEYCPAELRRLLDQKCRAGEEGEECPYTVKSVSLGLYGRLHPFQYDEPSTAILTQEVAEANPGTPRFDDVAGDLTQKLADRVGPAGALAVTFLPKGNGTVFHTIKPVVKTDIFAPRYKTSTGGWLGKWSNLHIKDVTGYKLPSQAPGCQVSWFLEDKTTNKRFYDQQMCLHVHETWWAKVAFNVLTGASDKLKWLIVAPVKGDDAALYGNRLRPGTWATRGTRIADVEEKSNVSTAEGPLVPTVKDVLPVVFYTYQRQLQAITGAAASGSMLKAAVFTSRY